jgi:uncharacterized membrane protein
MARLTKKDRTALRLVLADAERTLRFLRDNRTTVCVASSSANGMTYVPHDAAAMASLLPAASPVLSPIQKEVGSDLTGIFAAVDALGKFLATH